MCGRRLASAHSCWGHGQSSLRIKFMPGMGLIRTAPLKRLVLLVLCALAMLAWPGVAGAAQSAPVRAVALTSVRLISETPTESRFALVFAPRAVSYAVAAGAPNQ